PRREDRRGRARARAVRSQGDRGVPRRRRSARVSDAAPLLEVTGLEVAYGAIRALRGVDFVVHAGEIVTLIGSNGAGKSTLLRAVSGMLRPAAGRIRFDGEDVAGRRSDRLVALGISHVPEGRRSSSGAAVSPAAAIAAPVNEPSPPSTTNATSSNERTKVK